jgi:EmrB/QacA subfamily drug resistance transporter
MTFHLLPRCSSTLALALALVRRGGARFARDARMTLDAAITRVSARPCFSGGAARRWALVVAILGSTMAFLDATVVTVALPVMQRELGATMAEMQWIVEAYALLLASLVLVGGALGDRLGRRRVFVVGTSIFAVASAACAAAPNAMALVVTRAVQGIGAALLVPGSLALVTAAYPDEDRGGAIGTWSAASSITTALGPVLGGWIVAHASWRFIFVINVPLGAIVVLLARRRVAETRDKMAPSRVDYAGALLAVLGLGALVYALLDAPNAGGISSLRSLVLIGLGVGMLVAFVAVEGRRRDPMMPLSLFRNRTFSGANLLTLLLYAALGGVLFFLPFNLIQVQGYAPAAAGASLLPFIVLVSVMSPFTGRLVDRFGPRLPLTVGPLVVAGGFLLLARPAIGGPYVTTFFPPMVVLGLGMGMTVAPLTATVMGAVVPSHAGVASGINNAVARVAALLAIAAFGVVLQARFDDVLDRDLDAMALAPDARAIVDGQRDRLVGADLGALPPDARNAVRRRIDAAYLAGFRTVMIVSGILSLGGALGAAALLRGIRSAPPGPRPRS